MKRKYLIIHSGGSGIRSLGFGGSKADGEEWQFDTEELDLLQASSMSARTDVMIAPEFPIGLINPISGTSASEKQPWGLSAVGANKSTYDGSGVVVAILDTGCDISHEAFAGVKIAERNFTSDSDHDTDGHGTHCAGIIFGGQVGGVRIGIAPKIRKALIGKVLGSNATTVALVKGMEWAAENGASIINMSLGFDFPKRIVEWRDTYHYPEAAAISMALVDYHSTVSFFEKFYELLEIRYKSRTPLVIAASGNESKRNAALPFTVAACPPATSKGFMSVGALDYNGTTYSVADFSNTGVHISAPGVGVVSAALGRGLTSLNGTSMAAPHVSGVAALWLQKLIEEERGVTDILASHIKTLAQRDRIAQGFTISDFGAGLVQAP